MISTFTLNGIDMDVNPYGWHLLSNSKPRPGISPRVQQLVPGNRDGNTPVPMAEDSPLLTLMVRVPEAANETFLALTDAATLTLGHDGRTALVEMLSVTESGFDIGFTDYALLMRFPNLFWRDPSVTTSTVTAIPGTVSVLSGLSAPVRDSLVRVAGAFSNLVVADSQGTYFGYAPTVPAGSYLRFDSASGRAWVTTSNVWTGGTEVTTSITNGPSAYFLSLTPAFTDPATRAAQLTVTASAISSPTIEVRAARAYRI